MKISRWLPVLILFMAVGGGAGVWFLQRNNPTRSDENLERLLATVTRTDLQVEITATGTVQPLKTVNLSPKTAGTLVELLVEQGDRVEAGQLLARMDDRDIQAQLLQIGGNLAEAEARLAELQAGTRIEEIDRAQSQVQQSKARVEESQARLDLAQERFDRNRKLLAQGAIALDDLEASRTEVDQAAAVLSQSQAQLQESQRQWQQLKNGSRPETIAQAKAQVRATQGQKAALLVQLEDTRIRAPFDGTITQRYADPGAFVTPTTSASSTASATSTSIVALAQGLEILANVPEVDLTQLSLKQPVKIVADSYPDQEFEGTVRLIAPEAVKEQNVTSFQVRIALLSGFDRLRSGMNVDTTFLGKTLKSAIVAPTAAIVTLKGETGLLVPNDRQEPTFRPVVIGITIGDKTEILEGLEPGEKVFIDLPPEFNLDELEAN
ncbi:MAG: efflux RND transporter periplasmic adaptor subunit [Prochlorotrichaceae cyanobacterium]